MADQRASMPVWNKRVTLARAELVGAGGGGCMAALCPDDRTTNVAAKIESAGGKQYSQTTLTRV